MQHRCFQHCLRLSRNCCTAVLALALAPGAGTARAQHPNEKTGGAQHGISLSAQVRRDVVQRVLAHPGITERTRGRRLAAIRVTAGTKIDASGASTTIVTLILFDHSALETRRVLFDSRTGELLTDERLPGRPQRSQEELEEAAALIRGDPALARLLDEGGVLDGGFIVDDPRGSRRRMIQLKLLSRDRRSVLRSIRVDLTRHVIASPDEASEAAARFSSGAARSNGGR